MAVSIKTTLQAHKQELFLAIVFGMIVFGASYYVRTLLGGHAGDFSWPLNGARVLLQGENPYQRSDLGPAVLAADVLLYPLPTLVLLMPFTLFPDAIALSLFLALSATLLVYGILRFMPERLPIVLSAPFWLCILAGQWSILLTALLVLPVLRPLIVVKPTFALTAVALQPNLAQALRTVAMMIIICLVSWPLLWSWPLDWFHNLPKAHYERLIVAFTLLGIPVWLALLRWHNPLARLFLALMLVPLFPNFYDQVALSLIPDTRWRGVVFAGLSWAIFIVGRLIEQQLNATIVLCLVALGFLLAARAQPASAHNHDEVTP
jgi:hypothetical protein